ncbi:leucine-rich repeat and IQ domain-containing protein 3 isoform X1 [Ictalurus punctatus]|uniref:Leucine-rich repeat and IQ domain-containing protein 3 isoform X1 n=1 Tax=Ictalurus punctatus TaxID=7998 RepID=A0A2D0QWF3_ICTPU|nr:leucine-rich repeat and IQ domain-containing protein 3 isoform X1 [Ictalurus punctatus]XP_053536518.1 leucine-rich repeat and IQ domain-containing protein 3 isoform X1 [Ictalurus punctatus]
MENIRVQTDFESLNLEDGRTSSSLSSSSSPSSVCGEQDVEVVRRCALRLHSLKGVCVFGALRVCVLCDNFITDIEPLRQCENLLKLDLKGNQITQLPEASFWKNLKALQLLFLHDNDISVMSDVSGLSVCPSLSALTLYETPLSQMRNYRHCVINSIFSLKALDHHVISDEEIIENWQLPHRFKAMTPNLSINLYSSVNTDSDEVKVLRGIISEINKVQAAISPTLIIQKWIRGHLTRRRLGLCGAPVPMKTLVRNVTRVGSVWEISRRPWIQDMMSFRSFHCRTLTDLKPPCNTPQLSSHGDKLNIRFMERHDEVMDLESFRLFGFKAMTYLSKSCVDMLISQKRNRQDIRDGITHFHTQKSNPPTAPLPRPPNISAQKRLVVRHHDCLSLAMFQAIERAYEEREKEEGLRERAKRVIEVQNHRNEARGHREGFVEAQRTGTLLRHEQERDRLEKTLKLQRTRQEQEVQLVHQKYLRFLVEKQRNMMEQETVKRFSRQHGALTKAFSKYCTGRRLSETQHERRRQIAIGTQHPGSQGHLENRKQNKPMMSWISISPLLLQIQCLSDRGNSGEIQPILSGRSVDRHVNVNKIKFV